MNLINSKEKNKTKQTIFYKYFGLGHKNSIIFLFLKNICVVAAVIIIINEKIVKIMKTNAYLLIKRITSVLSENPEIISSQITENNYNYSVEVTKISERLRILVYFGKRGVSVVIQGRQSTGFYKQVVSYLNKAEIPIDNLSIVNPPKNNNFPQIGSDECGKGDFFGPLVVTAAYINKDVLDFVLSLGVVDSKLLSDSKINIIAEKLLNNQEFKFESLVLEPHIYNRLFNKYRNLNLILAKAHSKVINELLQKHYCNNVIIDKFAELRFDVENNFPEVKFTKIHKAESFLSVASASIISRYYFNQWFEKQKLSGFDFPKGSSAKTDMYVKKLFSSEISFNFDIFAKTHFKTLTKSENRRNYND